MRFYIIQSLRPGEPEIGIAIQDFLLKKGKYAHFSSINSIALFFEQLSQIAIDAAAHKEQVFVHLICHGNDEGIGIIQPDSTEPLISWNQLRASLRKIHLQSERRIVLCMSSCEGFNASKLVPQFQPCPYHYVAGSFEKISFKEARDGYKLFYDRVISGLSLHDAALSVHSEPDLAEMKFIALSSENILEIAISAFIKNECTPERLQQRKEVTKQQLLEMQPSLLPVQLKELDDTFSSVEGQQPYIERLRETFYS